MEFVQPILLWGLVGIAIPVLVHLWNGRKGKVVSWAAMQWLTEQKNQASRSSRIDHWLILLLRILFLVILVLLVSKPLVELWSEEKAEVVHLVQPDRALISEFRFELEQALDNGGKVIVMDSLNSELNSLDDVSQYTEFQGLMISDALQNLPEKIKGLNLYVKNPAIIPGHQFFRVPVMPTFFMGKGSAPVASGYLAWGNGYASTVNEEGRVVFTEKAPAESEDAIWSGQAVSFYMDSLSAGETESIHSAIKAIAEVYPVRFEQTGDQTSAMLYFGQLSPVQMNPNTLYFITNSPEVQLRPNVRVFRTALDYENAEQVRNGQLPELLLEELLGHLGLKRKSVPTTESQLKAHFLVADKAGLFPGDDWETVLSLLLVLTFIAERILSHRKGI